MKRKKIQTWRISGLTYITTLKHVIEMGSRFKDSYERLDGQGIKYLTLDHTQQAHNVESVSWVEPSNMVWFTIMTLIQWWFTTLCPMGSPVCYLSTTLAPKVDYCTFFFGVTKRLLFDFLLAKLGVGVRVSGLFTPRGVVSIGDMLGLKNRCTCISLFLNKSLF